MSDRVSVDFHELVELADDLTHAGERIRPFARSAVQFTAFNIKRDWKANAASGGLEGPAAAYPSAITYDTEVKATEIRAEIGAEYDRPGGKGGFLEESNGGVLAAPTHAGRDALEANEQDFFDGLELAAADAIGSDAVPMVFSEGA